MQREQRAFNAGRCTTDGRGNETERQQNRDEHAHRAFPVVSRREVRQTEQPDERRTPRRADKRTPASTVCIPTEMCARHAGGRAPQGPWRLSRAKCIAYAAAAVKTMGPGDAISGRRP
jgi:hypothetical protein